MDYKSKHEEVLAVFPYIWSSAMTSTWLNLGSADYSSTTINTGASDTVVTLVRNA